MAKAIQIKLNPQDLANLNRKLDKLSRLDRKEFSRQIGITAQSAAGLMVRNIKSIPFKNSKGGLGQSVHTEISDKKAVILNDKKYAPFIEFGTGKKVDLEDLLKLGLPSSYAMQFKGKGIKEINITPKPFFFSSIRVEFNKLLRRLNKIIDNSIK